MQLILQTILLEKKDDKQTSQKLSEFEPAYLVDFLIEETALTNV